MRLFAMILSAALAIVSVSAQSIYYMTTSTYTSTASMVTSSISAQTSEIACLANCATSDSTCSQACISEAASSVAGTASVNEVALCQGNCTQGNGSAADNLTYQQCLTVCDDEYYTSSTSSATSITSATTSTQASIGTSMPSTNASRTWVNATGYSTSSLVSSTYTSSATAKFRGGASSAAAAVLFVMILAL